MTLNIGKWQAATLVAGLLLSTAKGLKYMGIFGPGEALLLVFMLSVLNSHSRRTGIRGFSVTGVFWYILFTCLLIGYLLRSGMTEYHVFPRSLFAYVLCALVALSFLASIPNAASRDRVAKNLSIATLALAVMVAIVEVVGLRSLAGLDLYWNGTTTRFQGWSTDPNQFALIFVAAPFLAIHQFRQRAMKSSRARAWITVLGVIGLLSVVQFATESDSLMMGWLAGFVFLGFVGLGRFDAGVKFLAVLVVAVAVLVAHASGALQTAFVSVTSLYEKDSQGETRMTIWSDSLTVMSRSPIFGLGPEVGPISTAGGILEAHNNILHLGMSAGLVGILAYIGLFVYCFVYTLRSKDALLGAVVISLFAFSMLHTTVRHPLFWVLLMICIVQSCPGTNGPTPNVRDHSPRVVMGGNSGRSIRHKAMRGSVPSELPTWDVVRAEGDR